MKCVKCGQELQKDAAFCDRCGAKVEKKIQCQCGNALSLDAHFCGKCGKKVSDTIQTVQVEENTQPENVIKQAIPQLTKPDSLKEEILGKQIPATVWIVGLRMATFLGFFAVIILGICQWMKFADYGEGVWGFFIFLICAIIGFLCVFATMIFLDIAKDIRKIRQYADKK